MDRLLQIKVNKMRTECHVALRWERKSLGLGHTDVKTMIDKLDKDLLSATDYNEVASLCEFANTFIIYLHLL